MKDYYKILGIIQTSSTNEIKKAFRELALKWHPDKCKLPNAHQKFIEISEAYQFLSNPKKRKLYDDLRKNVFERQIVPTDSTYKQYDDWVKTERTEAERLARMSFKDYAKMMFNFIDNVHTGIAQIIGFVFGFGFFLDGILLIVLSFLYCLGKTDFFIFSSFYDLLWILPLSFVLLFLGDIMFYEPVCRLLGIKNRWWKVPIFKKWN